MRGKVRPTNLPTRSLEYYFMRSSFDTEDMKACQNLEPRLATPPNVKMGATVGVELLVRGDGTAEPSFLYGRGERDGRTTAVKGKPFYLDMTFATEEVPGTTYVGLDFGTSTSSICYVNEADILTYNARSSDRTWRSLRRRPKIAIFGICDFTGIGCLGDSRVRGERLYRDDDRRIIPARPV